MKKIIAEFKEIFSNLRSSFEKLVYIADNIKEIENIKNEIKEIKEQQLEILQLLKSNSLKDDKYIKPNVLQIENTEENPNEIPVSIINFLKQKQIEIDLENSNIEFEFDETLDNIALYMGDKFQSLKKTVDALKKSSSGLYPIKLYLKDGSTDEISFSCQLFSNLFKLALLSDYKYLKSASILTATVNRDNSHAINFFNGFWLERYIKIKLNKIINSLPQKINYNIAKGLRISLNNGKKGELDMIVEINNQIIWIEAKTGDYQKHIQKYSDLAKKIDVKKENVLLVLSDTNITEQTLTELNKLYNLTIVSIDKFPAVIEERITAIVENQ